MSSDAMSSLERDLEEVLLRLYEQWKSVGYTAIYFKRMLTPGDPIFKGPVGTVRHLLSKEPTAKSGFVRLRDAGKLDWTIEALFNGEAAWHALFGASEIAKARTRFASAVQP
jgi:hypothetical protein